jgi:tetratricopeptide (TPR) repeat protein
MAKGNLDKAIDEWQKLISESPNDGNIYNTIGDLYLRKKDQNKATDSYLKAAEVFNNAGFALKSIALYKKILKLNPKRHDVHLKLSDVNAVRGLTGNAIEGYLTVAKQYNQDGRVKDAIGVYRKIANLDPNNNSIRLNLAELCFKEGFEEEAVKEYLQLAKVYTESGQMKEAEATYEKILKLDPKNEEARAAIGIGIPAKEDDAKEDLLSKAEAAMEKEVYDEAERLLRQLVATDPNNTVYQEKLGYLFLKKGQHFMAFNPLKTAVQIYLEKGEADHAVRLMEDYLSQGPDQIEAHQLLATACEQQGDNQKAILQFAQVIDQHLSMNEINQAQSLFEKIKGLDAEHPDVRRLHAAFERSLTETAEKIDSNKLEVSQPQEPVEALESSPSEISHSQESVDVLESTQPDIREIREQDHVLEPTQSEVHTGQESAEIHELGRPEKYEAPQPAEVQKLPADEMETMNLLTEAEVYAKYGLVGKAIEQLKQVLSMEPDNIQAHLQLKEIYQAEGRRSEAADQCLRLAALYKKWEDNDSYHKIIQEAHQLDPELPQRKEEASLADLLDSGHMEAILTDNETDSSAARRDQAASESPSQTENIVETEAAETSTVKGNESLEDTQDKEEELEKPFSSEDPLMKSEDFLDLSQIIEEELKEVSLAPQPVQSRDDALRSVISVFHDKETEAQQEDVDPETHYNLGIAYSEMGLISEAIEEFKLSAQSSERFVDSHSMLSACYRKKGKTSEAIQPLEVALADPRCGRSEKLWLSYDLALLYEQLDRFDDALKLYSKVHREDPSFKDVKHRLDTLRQSIKKGDQSFKIKQQDQEQDEDVDSMLERLFDDSQSGDELPGSKQKDPTKKKSRIS